MSDNIIKELINKNKEYSIKNKKIFQRYLNNQSPSIAILTCSDSRVIPEYIFNKSIGELFVIRIAGNIAIDSTIIKSIEYAVDHLKVSHLIILGHTNCGAVKAAEESNNDNNILLKEIRDSFILNPDNHIKANIMRQLIMLPKRSEVINNQINNNILELIGAVYNLKDGLVDFIS